MDSFATRTKRAEQQRDILSEKKTTHLFPKVSHFTGMLIPSNFSSLATRRRLVVLLLEMTLDKTRRSRPRRWASDRAVLIRLPLFAIAFA